LAAVFFVAGPAFTCGSCAVWHGGLAHAVDGGTVFLVGVPVSGRPRMR